MNISFNNIFFTYKKNISFNNNLGTARFGFWKELIKSNTFSSSSSFFKYNFGFHPFFIGTKYSSVPI
jgi:hypothetical protein